LLQQKRYTAFKSFLIRNLNTFFIPCLKFYRQVLILDFA
jgi:hypothetical protein